MFQYNMYFEVHLVILIKWFTGYLALNMLVDLCWIFNFGVEILIFYL